MKARFPMAASLLYGSNKFETACSGIQGMMAPASTGASDKPVFPNFEARRAASSRHSLAVPNGDDGDGQPSSQYRGMNVKLFGDAGRRSLLRRGTGTTDVVAGRRLRHFPGALAALAVALVLTGCGESHSDLVRRQHVQIVELVRNLGAALDSGRIRNANIIKQYAQIVRRGRPEVAALVAELSKEATTRGLAYTSLAGRLDRVNISPADQREADESMEDLLRIEAASDAVVFNDSLIDVVNVLADLSDGKLSRLQIPRSEPRPETGPGSHLVGNPRYGEWRQGSGGSFWQFYGQYALMRDLFFGPATYYHRDWYPNRGWSYYGDVGRHYYGTRTDTRRWDRAGRTQRAPPRKSYGPLRSERRLSTYGRATNRSAGAATRRASTYSRNYGSSARGTSRASGFRGK